MRLTRAAATDAGAWYTTALWAAPAGVAPVIAAPDTDLVNNWWGRYGGERQIAVTFLGPDYIAIDDEMETSGPMLNDDHTLSIRSLDSLAAHGYGTNSGLLGRPADPRFSVRLLRREFAACVRQSTTADDVALDPDAPGEESWGIVRVPGHWRYVRRFGHGTGAARGYYTDCGVGIRPAASIVGPDRLTPSWPIVKQHVREARDAFSPAAGGVLVVLTDSSARVYRPRGCDIGAPVFQTHVPSGTVVMAQWLAVERGTRIAAP